MRLKVGKRIFETRKGLIYMICDSQSIYSPNGQVVGSIKRLLMNPAKTLKRIKRISK